VLRPKNLDLSTKGRSVNQTGVNGKYFEHRRETPCRFAADRAAVEALYAGLRGIRLSPHGKSAIRSKTVQAVHFR
jgi:hypothetical protein